MKILTPTEGKKWLLENNLPIDEGKLRFLYKSYIAYELPDPATEKTTTILVKGFSKIINEINDVGKSEGLLWITRDGLHDYDHFDSYLKSLNGNLTQEEELFYVFDKSDIPVLERLLEFTFNLELFAFLIPPKKETIIYVNESWFIDVSCKNITEYEVYKRLFGGLDLREIFPRKS